MADSNRFPILTRHWPGIDALNVARIPDAHSGSVIPNECQALWCDAVDKCKTYKNTRRRFHDAYTALSWRPVKYARTRALILGNGFKFPRSLSLAHAFAGPSKLASPFIVVAGNPPLSLKGKNRCRN